MSTYFTSDLHFGHEAVIRYCNRPFSNVAEMDEFLLHQWNLKVRPEDTVFVLGDLALCRFQDFEPIARQLQGNKILIQGNHDGYSVGQYQKLGFTVYRELRMKLAGYMVRLSHYPYALPWYRRPFAYKSELRYMDRRPPRIPGEWLLHGHTHSKKKITAPGLVHVGTDAWGYRPVSIREVESLISSSLKGKSQNKKLT